jgi:3-oxoacyl-[acyl-carrier protein] reductase
MHEPRLFTAADLRTGLHAEFERDITLEDVAAFADLSHDWNPLHTNEEYARQTNYGKRIVHGAFQVGLASAMAGMYLPGREVVVGGFQCRFPAPLFYPSRVRVQGEITAWNTGTASGSLRVRVAEIVASVLTAEIHVSFALHETRSIALRDAEQSQEPEEEGKPIVLLTGASGGLGQRVAAVLSDSYHVIGIARSRPQTSDSGVEWLIADFASGDWEQEAERHLRGRRIYGLVHAAWPPGPQGGLLETEENAIRTQLEFGGVGTVRAARFLRSQAAAGGARMVVLGTTAATVKPALNMAAYSLGKATLEHAVRLLAPELARANITINTVAPSFVPIGMNNSKTNKVILTETAKVPLGKLCSPEDVARTVDFLLSPGAAFITGQMLPLTGGQL